MQRISHYLLSLFSLSKEQTHTGILIAFSDLT